MIKSKQNQGNSPCLLAFSPEKTACLLYRTDFPGMLLCLLLSLMFAKWPVGPALLLEKVVKLKEIVWTSDAISLARDFQNLSRAT